MQEAALHLVFWCLKAALWVWIFVQGRRLGLAREYPLLYVYFGVAAATDTAMLLARYVFLDVNTYSYAYLYVSCYLTTLAASSAVALWIYFLHDRPRMRDIHLAVVPAVLILVEFTMPQGKLWFWEHVISVVYGASNYFAIAALLRRAFSRRVAMGWNVAMVLIAFTLPGALHALVSAAGTSGYLDAAVWKKFAALSAWIILAVAMTEHSPPELAPAGQMSYGESLFRMRRRVKLLWSVLRH